MGWSQRQQHGSSTGSSKICNFASYIFWSISLEVDIPYLLSVNFLFVLAPGSSSDFHQGLAQPHEPRQGQSAHEPGVDNKIFKIFKNISAHILHKTVDDNTWYSAMMATTSGQEGAETTRGTLAARAREQALLTASSSTCDNDDLRILQ